MNCIYDQGAYARLLELDPAVAPSVRYNTGELDWSQPNCAGPRLENALALKSLDRIYDYVTTGEWHGNEQDLEDVLHELGPLQGIARGLELEGPTGDLIPADARLKLKTAMDHLNAREALRHGSPLDLRQIALLAGLAEKTVRMAAMRTGEGPELATVRQDNRTWVEAAEALRWLSGKRNFRPTKFRELDRVQTPEPTTIAQLRWSLRTLREHKNLTTKELANRLKWDPQTVAEYRRLEEGANDPNFAILTVKRLLQVATLFEVSDPHAFARAAARIVANAAIDAELADHQSGERH